MPSAVLPPPGMLRSGDLVFRTGRGWRADAVRALSRDALTHVGIVDVDAHGVYVIHAAPPEAADPGGAARVPLSRFAAPEEAAGIAVYRRRDVGPPADARIVRTARAYARRHVPFDGAFDLGDGSAMYCSELVLRASAAAGVPLPSRTTTLEMGPLAGRYVLPRDLLVADTDLVFTSR